jgi:hypothetical protein
VKFSIAVLQTIEKTASIPAFSCSEGSTATKVIILEASLIDVPIVFQDALLLTAIIVLSLEAIVRPAFLTLSVQHIVPEHPMEGDISRAVTSLPVAPSELYLPLIVISICVDESAEAMRKAVEESALIIPSVGVVILAVAMRLAIQPLPFEHYPRPSEEEEAVQLCHSPLIPQPAVALQLDGFYITQEVPKLLILSFTSGDMDGLLYRNYPYSVLPSCLRVVLREVR